LATSKMTKTNVSRGGLETSDPLITGSMESVPEDGVTSGLNV
jgi:hypothetical protein